MNVQIKHVVVVALGAFFPAALALVDAAPVLTLAVLEKWLVAGVLAAVAVLVPSPLAAKS